MKTKKDGALNSVKNTVLHSLDDMRRNNIEISLRFSWLDAMLAVMGTVLFIMSLAWMIKKCKNIFSCKRKKKSEQSDQS